MILDIENKNGYKVYNMKFSNLTDLHLYLKDNPEVNKRVFRKQSSLDTETRFHGEHLDKCIDYCIGGYKNGFESFLKTNNDLKKLGVQDNDTRTLKRSLYGGIPLSPLVAAGVPDCMLRYDRSEDLKYVTIYFNLGYPHYTTEKEIVNRGLATMHIIQALENKGYIVNFKAFELSYCNDEMINITINLKKPGDLFLNIEKCYFPIKAKEFLRRILFRVLESMPVEDYSWSGGYGRAADRREMERFFGTKSTDLIIASPEDMGISGDNIYEDTLSLINKLNIQDEFDINKIKKLCKEYKNN